MRVLTGTIFDEPVFHHHRKRILLSDLLFLAIACFGAYLILGQLSDPQDHTFEKKIPLQNYITPGKREMSDDFSSASSALLVAILVVGTVEMKALWASARDLDQKLRKALAEDCRRRTERAKAAITELSAVSDEDLKRFAEKAITSTHPISGTKAFQSALARYAPLRLNMAATAWLLLALFIAVCVVRTMVWMSLPGDPKWPGLAAAIVTTATFSAAFLVFAAYMGFSAWRSVERIMELIESNEFEYSRAEIELREEFRKLCTEIDRRASATDP
ncbi:hypothetical protein [Streptomyces albus]|uniref:hypothetical protein n=1 Tax=Streptomyces albus TaxID=1888 RepID=UPI0034537D6D